MGTLCIGVLRGQKRWYLQVDGASDNIAYTMLYFAAWLLIMAQKRHFGDLLAHTSITHAAASHPSHLQTS